jgi:hypothetical protein
MPTEKPAEAWILRQALADELGADTVDWLERFIRHIHEVIEWEQSDQRTPEESDQDARGY